ncbi:MAG: sulfite exporter TauE/SafE family protein [Planctomycetaceae bacterium]
MTPVDAALLFVGGCVAGVINAMAGGGSTLTIPLLVLAGVPGVVANGTNRVGILASSITTWASFRREGVAIDLRSIKHILIPAFFGAAVGAFGVSQVTNDAFERGFGLLIIPIVILTIRKPRITAAEDRWSIPLTVAVFFAIGIYAGAIQAGVGLLLVAALNRNGFDLVTANTIKVIFTVAATLIALPIFITQGNVRWLPGLVLAVGLCIGGWLGARFAVRGGEKLIRYVMIVAALTLAAKLLGLF